MNRYFRLLMLGVSVVTAVRTEAQERSWVNSTLSAMTVEEKVGQLFIADLVAVYNHNESPLHRYAAGLVERYHVGGFVLAGGTISDIALMTNALQRESTVPLLINADLESGLSFSHPWEYMRGRAPELPRFIAGGGTAFTSMMAVGATGNPQFAYEIGKVTAREARAVGIHWTNSPVSDVNINPNNPIINTRSFGEDPASVARFVEACVRGLQDGRLMATLKHFPGHGDTEEDTHMKLPVLQFDEKRLLSVEFVPFKAGIQAGVKAVMTAHISLKKIDPSGAPATLSRPVLTGLLRERLGFDGVVVTDGMTMQGVTDKYGADEAAVLAIEAGADCILVPDQFETAFNGIIAAVRSGRISSERLDTSVRRILEAKQWVGLDVNKFVDIARVPEVVGAPESDSIAQTINDAAVTLLRNVHGVVPVSTRAKAGIVTLSLGCNNQAGSELERVLDSAGATVHRSNLFNGSSETQIQKLLAELKGDDVIIVGLYLSIESWKGEQEFSSTLEGFLNSLAGQGKPVITIAFGDPYVIAKVPTTDAVMTPFDGSRRAEVSVGNALLGRIDIKGRLPITIPGKYKVGEGIQLISPTRTRGH